MAAVAGGRSRSRSTGCRSDYVGVSECIIVYYIQDLAKCITSVHHDDDDDADDDDSALRSVSQVFMMMIMMMMVVVVVVMMTLVMMMMMMMMMIIIVVISSSIVNQRKLKARNECVGCSPARPEGCSVSFCRT